MFVITSVYFLIVFLIFWGYAGYIILLFIFHTLIPKEDEEKSEPIPIRKPKIAIIVPCFNEESFIDQKADSLKELIYDQDKLDVFFLHGLSSDSTSMKISKFISDMPNWHLIETGCKGKINQINYGLSKLRDVDIIVNTDADVILSPDILIKFVNEFNSDNRVAVVGANISPGDCLPIEEDYWRDQNLLRIIESKVYTSSIVVAPCYAYRAFLIDKFPEDCIADDIFIAFKANTEGYFTRYLRTATGTELRIPNTFSDFFRHKFRKGNAYLVEIFRYLYRLPYMSGWWKVIYLTKVLQLAVIPWVLPYFVLSTISLALSGRGFFQVALFGLVFLLSSIALTSFLMKKARLKYLARRTPKIRSTFLLFTISNLILILVGLTYPFYKQSSNYPKMGRTRC